MHYDRLFRRKIAHHGVFYLAVMLYALLPAFPVNRLVPSPPLVAWYNNHTTTHGREASIHITAGGGDLPVPLGVRGNYHWYDAQPYHLMWAYVPPELRYTASFDEAAVLALNMSVTSEAEAPLSWSVCPALLSTGFACNDLGECFPSPVT
jgi:hypothetical protein